MKAMKPKKAIKRLNKAQALISSVIDQYAAGKSGAAVRDLLQAAGNSIDQAKASIEGTRTPPAGTLRRRRITRKQNRNLSAEGRKKLSLAARKRWAAAKRKGMRTLAVA
jgi:hypothetical protein